jgi:hypothetical protein
MVINTGSPGVSALTLFTAIGSTEGVSRNLILGCFQRTPDISVGSYPIHIENESIYSANSCRISDRKKKQ